MVNFLAEFDALTGCKLSSINIGASVVRMAYSPAGGHVIVAVLEDWSIKSQENTQDLRRDGDTHCSDTTSTVAVLWNVSAFKCKCSFRMLKVFGHITYSLSPCSICCKVWRTRVILSSNKPPMRANFFESAEKLRSSYSLCYEVLRAPQEKLVLLGSAGILSDYELQMQRKGKHHTIDQIQ
ncbi:hypothetical protein SELMODRAFT_427363 [Selaginella moellendorffii]|uniref:Uncharacterized protein n=1 Tax=Selaginella moellendorffii TaxID=88036 RepID=D8SZC2_SELML|nr:hypothetical protein SELMODRAFT_427363 [Selaginella moellendorffii]